MSGRWRRLGGSVKRRTCVRFPSDPSRTMRCMDRVSLEQLLGRGLSLAEIGRRFEKHEATVAYWVARHGLRAANRDKHAARGALAREELERLVGSGASIAEIAEAVGRSKATVRHWLREYGLKTRRGTMQVRAEQLVRSEQPARTTRDCHHHGATEFQLRAEGGYRCLKCRSEAVSRRRRRVKQTLVEEAGGACQHAATTGASRPWSSIIANLERSGLLSATAESRVRSTRARAEAAKCILLCANCHAEVEAGFRSLA